MSSKFKYQHYKENNFFAYIPTLSFVNFKDHDLYFNRKQITFYWLKWVFIFEFGGQVQDVWEGME